MKTTFGEISEGEKFRTPYSMRLMTCRKIGVTYVAGSEHGLHLRNAFIILDHTDRPADDLGTLIHVEDKAEVEKIE